MIKIRYSNHACERLEGRGISNDEVEQAIRDGAKSDAGDDVRKAVLRNETGLLVVIYVGKSVDEVEIITVYRQ